MFDPKDYFNSLKHALAGCEKWAETMGPDPKIFLDGFGKWLWCTWRFDVEFANGCKLTALESHSMRKGKHLRKIKYRLVDADEVMIVQVDHHGLQVPFEDSPHIHIGPDQNNRVYEGDAQLKGYSLRDYDFHKMWALVEKFINGEGLPWQV